MKTIDIFLNFPVTDMNRNVLWNNPKGVDESDLARMNAFWGDDSWRRVAYGTDGNLFGYEEKTDNMTVARAFQERLKKVAGFSFVPDPMLMRNSKSATLYYLFFASYNQVGNKIANAIFKKYRYKGKS